MRWPPRWLGLGLLALAACRGQARGGPVVEPAGCPPAAGAMAAQVELVTAGAAPRAVARVGGARGARRAVLALTTRERDRRGDAARATEQAVDSRRDDRLAFDLTVDPAGGAERIELVLDTQHGPAPLPPELARAGLRGSWTIDRCGRVRDQDLAARTKRGPRLDDWTRPVALPEEPIGVGARWQVARTVDVDGAAAHELATYQLVGRSAARLALSLVLTEYGGPAVVAVPGVAVGEPPLARLALSGAGIGDLHLDLATGLVTGGVTTRTDASFRYGAERWQVERTDTSQIDEVAPR